MSVVQEFRYQTPQHKKSKIAIVLHQATSSAGRVGQILQKMGFHLDIYRPVLGDKLPETLENHAGVVIFGGPMSANDKSTFILDETDWISIPLKENKPFFGICLGAQMLARHIGGTVHGKKDGEVEIGWYPIEATAQGRALLDWPDMVYHFHREGIYNLPKDAEILAQGNVFPTQAFRYGQKAWGVQFHAELTRAMLQRWVVHGAEHLKAKGAQAAQKQLDKRFIYDPKLLKWLETILIKIFGTVKIDTKN
ncbi:glutamine amidotransferase [Bartonella tamiae]|uniref:Glutamine amidotransferase domain-containing protein n=1 Tax=Bartonella tamiae Th239 TaxID=1094558 RepID=J1K257_9HYPH|nr:glutamine amidotransferase [Bartonella tamiae]EJF91542.1 hypothetical protein ME5_00237 [Bartonella tamiae Th239]EJF92474.1 hypothetical protein MEG_01644 [Bartonella tamiae Th307]